MKYYIFCGVLIFLLLNVIDGFTVERRLREGNNFQRKLRSCTFTCALKDRFRLNNLVKCYKIPSQNNVTISECEYNCLRFKREQISDAESCLCRNKICVKDIITETTTNAEQSSETTKPTTTPAQTTQPDSTPAQTTQPDSTPAQTTQPDSTPAQTTQPDSTPAQTTQPDSTPAQTNQPNSTPVQTNQPNTESK